MGMRVHSGLGALVGIAGDTPKIELLDRRRRIFVTNLTNPKFCGAASLFCRSRIC